MAQKTVTANGDAQLDTAQKKFGTSSGLFDGTGDYLNLDGDADFTFGTGDFTVDFWVRLSANGKQQTFYDGRPNDTNGAYVAIAVLADNTIIYYSNTAIRIQGTTSLSTGVWYHIALSRNGTSTKLFLNGTQEGSTYTDSTNYLNGPTTRPWIGADANQGATTNNLDGWFDEFRVSKGIARWTANFTVPSSAYYNDADTVLLLHLDGLDGSTTFVDSSADPYFIPTIINS